MAEFTAKQERFIKAYNGNATTAAIEAGYSAKTAYSAGQRLLKNVGIQAAIRKRESQRSKTTIATREERQQFWSKVMWDEHEKMQDRLRAAELLGKSEADFIERQEISGPDQGPVLVMGAEMSAAVLKRTREILEGMK